MTKRTKTELITQVDELLLDNTSAQISPADIRSVFTDYADSLALWDGTEPTAAGAYASATITFSGVPATNETVVIIDTAGTSKTYTAKAAETLSSGFFNQSGTAAQAAASLKDCIEDANGHNGTITIVDNGSGGLTLTQASTGSSGNTTITEGLANVTKTDFTSGVTAVPSCVKGEVVFAKGTTSYLYVCIDTSLWRRSELGTF